MPYAKAKEGRRAPVAKLILPAVDVPSDLDVKTVRACVEIAQHVALGGVGNGAEKAGAFKVVHRLEKMLDAANAGKV